MSNLPVMDDEKRLALIDFIQARQSNHAMFMPVGEYQDKSREVYEVALAALTAPQPDPIAFTFPGEISNLKDSGVCRVWGDQCYPDAPVKLYTEPPAPQAPIVNLPPVHCWGSDPVYYKDEMDDALRAAGIEVIE